MIPTLLLAGLVVGMLPAKWALVGVVVLGLGWGVLLFSSGTVTGVDGTFWAALLGLANAVVGASISQSVRLGARFVRSEWTSQGGRS